MWVNSEQPFDPRENMIRETSKWIEWALANPHLVQRIPRRRVDQGGFTEILKHRGARALVQHWWQRVLSN